MICHCYRGRTSVCPRVAISWWRIPHAMKSFVFNQLSLANVGKLRANGSLIGFAIYIPVICRQLVLAYRQNMFIVCTPLVLNDPPLLDLGLKYLRDKTLRVPCDCWRMAQPCQVPPERVASPFEIRAIMTCYLCHQGPTVVRFGMVADKPKGASRIPTNKQV